MEAWWVFSILYLQTVLASRFHVWLHNCSNFVKGESWALRISYSSKSRKKHTACHKAHGKGRSHSYKNVHAITCTPKEVVLNRSHLSQTFQRDDQKIQFPPYSCQGALNRISRKWRHFMQPRPAKISSAVVSGRFGVGGCSELHYLLIQATTPGVGQGITNRWVAEQCTPCHQSHIPAHVFSIPAHVFSITSFGWMPPGTTPGGRASLRKFGFHLHQRPHGSLSTHKQL